LGVSGVSNIVKEFSNLVRRIVGGRGRTLPHLELGTYPRLRIAVGEACSTAS
jgi:hypothetical protein